jgi:hypothetical protein
MMAFIGSFMHLGQILIPILFFMLFYAVVGLHLFSGLTEMRCREGHEPEGGEWVASEEYPNLCGIWQCPHELTCGSPADHGLPRNYHENDSESFFYNFSTFDDFFKSLFVIYLFINITGWTGTTYFVNYLSILIVLEGNDHLRDGLLFLQSYLRYVHVGHKLSAFILSNLLLGAFYETFIVQSTIKSNQGERDEGNTESLNCRVTPHQTRDGKTQIGNDDGKTGNDER